MLLVAPRGSRDAVDDDVDVRTIANLVLHAQRIRARPVIDSFPGIRKWVGKSLGRAAPQLLIVDREPSRAGVSSALKCR